MIKGAVSARAVALQDLMSDLKVLDKKEISLGLLQLDINEQTKRALEEEIEQKHRNMVVNDSRDDKSPNYQEPINELRETNKEKEEEEQEQSKSIDGADDLII